MRIIVEPDGFNYTGRLYIDNEIVATHSDVRPGCCVRKIMNDLLYKYGKPNGPITVDIDGW